MRKKVALHNLGCKVNAYETEAMAELLKNRGYEIVPFGAEADIYIINTCTVTNIADRKSRQMLHKAKKLNPDAVIVAAGCYVQATEQELKQDDSVDIIVGNNRKKEIADIIEEYQRNLEEERNAPKKKGIHVEENRILKDYENLTIDSMEEHTRAYMKIQDGCNQFCTYCIIPYARGRVRSRKLPDIIKEVERLTASGYQEVVLTGIHLSSYGVDFKDERISLIHVIREIAKNPGIRRIRLGSLEPGIITDEFMREIVKIPSFCPQFHLSLQSGCDKTLERMNRKYTSGEYFNRCECIRRYYPNAAITTDVIAGFPGETEEEFSETKKFLERVKFSKIHVFKYSRREGTKAAGMENQITDSVKAARSDELMALEENMRVEYLERLTGTEQEVLFEESVKIWEQEYFIGHTKEYVKTAVLTEQDLTNKILTVKIKNLLNTEIVLAEF